MKKILFLFAALSLLNVKAQNSNPNQNLNFDVSFLNADPIIDGEILEEMLWDQVFPIRDLKQIKPNYCAPASEKTEIRIAYTSKTLYVAVVCFDKASQDILEEIEFPVPIRQLFDWKINSIQREFLTTTV